MIAARRSRSLLLVVGGLVAAVLFGVGVTGSERAVVAGGTATVERPAGGEAVAVPARVSKLLPGARRVPERSSRFSDTYVGSDGSRLTRISTSPLNFQDRTGRWRPIDNTLVARGDAYVNRAGSHVVRLPRQLARGVSVSSGDGRLSMRLLGADAPAAVRGTRATYRGVLQGVTALYDSQAHGLREQLVIADARAPRHFAFALTVSAGLRPRIDRAGGIAFLRGRHAAFVIPPAMTFPRNDEGEVHPARNVLRRSTHGWTLTVIPDRDWVERELRHGSVVLDPTVEIDPDTQDCSMESDTPTTSYCSDPHLLVGYHGGTGAHDHRSLVQFDLSVLPKDAVILNADLGLTLGFHSTNNLKQVGVYQVKRAWTNSMTWNRYDATNSWAAAGASDVSDAATTAAAVQTVGDATGFVDWYPTRLLQGWVDGTIDNHGVLIRDVTPNTTSNELDFSSREGGSVTPELDIVWAPRTGALGSYHFDAQQLTDRSTIAVNVANGNLLVANNDVHVAGTGMDLDVTRYHNSMGTGWGDQGVGIPGTMSLGRDVKLTAFADGSVAYFAGDGVVMPFLDRTVSGSTASFASPPDLNATLKQNTTTGVYTLTFDRTQIRELFDSDGQLTSVKDRNDNTISLAYYSSSGQGLSQITDTQGRVFSVDQVAGDGYVDSITDPTSRTWAYTYGHFDTDYLTDYEDPAGHHTQYDYDSSHRLVSITTPGGNVAKITYSGTSEKVASIMRTTDAGHTTGPTRTFAYSTGSPCTTGQTKTVVSDPNGHDTTFCSDVKDRVVLAMDADSRTRSSSYNANSDVVTGTSAGSTTLPGFDTTYTYDPSSNSPTQRVRTTGTGTSPTTLTDSATYNATGSGCSPAATWLKFLPDTTTDPQSNVTTVGRDCKGNLTSVRDQLTVQNQITLGSYDSKGNPHTSMDANGNTTTYGYDTAGRLTSITPPGTTAPSTQLGNTALSYDSLGRVHTITDGKNQTSTIDYDVMDRQAQVTYDGGSTVAISYDNDGNPTQRVETAGSTRTTTYTHDKLNRLTREDFPDGSFNVYGYDNAGNLTSFQDASGTTSYTQSVSNLLSGLTEPGASSSYSFGNDGNAFRNTTTFPNGVVVTLSHDGIGRITRLVAKKGSTTLKDVSYGYTKTSGADTEQLRTMTDNVSNDVTSYSYDVLNRLTDAWTKNGSTTVRRYQYTLDGNGNITQRVVTVGTTATTTTYAYNQNNQLCWAYTGTSSNGCGSPPSGATTYSYDANGNQTGTGSPSTSLSYNAKDQTTSLFGTSMGYLGDGQNELITDGTASLHNSILDTTSRTVSATTDYFTRDDQGLLLADRGPSSTKYYLLDPLSSVIATTNASGAVSASYAYDPYGNSIGTAPSPFGYVSGYRAAGGLYHFGARYYGPSDQRWTQVDAISDPADLNDSNGYTYAGGDPTDLTDPAGTVPARDPCQYQPYKHVSRRNYCKGYPYTNQGTRKFLAGAAGAAVSCYATARKLRPYGLLAGPYAPEGEAVASVAGCVLGAAGGAEATHGIP
jgi:RHS repeat-associated protein